MFPKISLYNFSTLLKKVFLKFTLVMASFSVSNNNMKLILSLQRQGIIHSSSVVQGMSLVDRANYVASSETNPYTDSPHYIGHGQTISAPHMHGYALEYLEPNIMVLLPTNILLYQWIIFILILTIM